MIQIDKEALLLEIDKKQKEQGMLAVAIDGRCASGKTTLAAWLQEKLSCSVISMDSFFLRQEQRSEERYASPGGNVDYERFCEEVLPFLKKGEAFSYRPFHCQSMQFAEPIVVPARTITIVEGSYSCHPALWDAYDIHVFLTTDAKTQMERIRKRNGEAAAQIFAEKWIVLEEKYFAHYQIAERCDYGITT